MRRWGLVISLVYVLIVAGLLVPATIMLFGVSSSGLLGDLEDTYSSWVLWVVVGVIVVSQVLLLFLSVDTSQKRLKPRSPVLVSAITGSALFLFLTVCVVLCVGAAIYGDEVDKKLPDSWVWAVGILAGIWAAWGVVFYLYLRDKTEAATRMVSWLLKGSILELLVAVPCHVIVRRRHDCSAPLATSFGITTGIAIMLLSFGPSVLFLYKKRMDAYRSAELPENRERHAPVS